MYERVWVYVWAMCQRVCVFMSAQYDRLSKCICVCDGHWQSTLSVCGRVDGFPPVQMNHDSFRNMRNYSFVVWLLNQPLTSQYIYGKRTACLYLHNSDRSQNIPVWEGSACIYVWEDNKSLDDHFNLCHRAKVPSRSLFHLINTRTHTATVVLWSPISERSGGFVPAVDTIEQAQWGPILVKYLWTWTKMLFYIVQPHSPHLHKGIGLTDCTWLLLTKGWVKKPNLCWVV